MLHDVIFRAWQKKLHDVVKDKQHKAEIYKFLLLLMTEEDTTVLNTNIDLFLDFWEPQQPKFVAYFRQFYTNRVGECMHSVLYTYMHTVNKLFEGFAESL